MSFLKMAKCSKFKHLYTYWGGDREIGQCHDWIFQFWFKSDWLILKTDSDLTGVSNLISHFISYSCSLIQILTVHHIRIYFKLIQIWLVFQISFHISFLILVVWFKSELYTILEYISNLIHISFASNYTSYLSIVLMSAVETFEILFKSENSYLSSSIWKNEMAAGPA